MKGSMIISDFKLCGIFNRIFPITDVLKPIYNTFTNCPQISEDIVVSKD
jgi:hypothetical protein